MRYQLTHLPLGADEDAVPVAVEPPTDPAQAAPITDPAPHPHAAAVLTNVHKRFDGVRALNGLDLTIPPGAITVLLGPNGAGKTTAVRAITGALPVDAGTVSTFALDPVINGEAVRRRCGVVAAKPALYDRMSGRDNLAYSAALHDVTEDVDDRIVAVASRFGIANALRQTVGGYSTGMKTRLALARSLLHDPDMLLLDEPTSGLDPESAHAVLALIRELADAGMTIVMCTHLLIEAEGLADQIVVLDDGVALQSGTQQELIRRYWPTSTVRIETENAADLAPISDGLLTIEGVLGAACDPDGGIFVDVEDEALTPDLVAHLASAGVRILRVHPDRPSLEALYFRVRREHREHRTPPAS